MGKKNESNYFPLLKDELILPKLPSVTVDSGAVKFICNGANVMRPGITKIDGEFNTNDLLVVKEEKYGKMIAVGTAIITSNEMRSTAKGPVITNLHYVGDKFWEMLKGIHA
ncbi:MAG: RNA-binding protein [Thaumarchaeota archaeon]|nr:RNA-binding protein [Nitrososphaerota archaeon]